MNKRLSTVAACALVMASSMASGSEAGAIESIQRYCAASWRQARISQQDWNDCTQQVLLRLLDTISREGLVDAIEENCSPQRRELNRAIWATTKRWQRARREQPLVDADAAATPADDSVRQEMRRLVAGADGLSDRQRQILQSTLDGAAVREIADELGVPSARVSDDKYKAIQRLRSAVAEHGMAAEELSAA